MKGLISLLLTSFLLITAFGKGALTAEEEATKTYYHEAFEELNQMLEDEVPISFKRAVFVTENAYLENVLSFEDFQKDIDFLAGLSKLVMASTTMDYYKKDRLNVLKSYAIYSVIKDSLSFPLPVPENEETQWVYETEPFTYDLDDFWGQDDWTKMFVSKLLIEQTGNCHSLPILYKILADELDAKAYLSIAPNHTYIKQWNDKTGWYNTELTTGRFPFDADIKWNSYIKTESVVNGVYMDTLSNKQSIAYIITDLAQGYLRKFEYRDIETPIEWLDKALIYYPNYINALILKAELEKRRIENQMISDGLTSLEDVKSGSQWHKKLVELEQDYYQIHNLGYRRMPEEMYFNWLFRVQKTRQDHLTNLRMHSLLMI